MSRLLLLALLLTSVLAVQAVFLTVDSPKTGDRIAQGQKLNVLMGYIDTPTKFYRMSLTLMREMADGSKTIVGYIAGLVTLEKSSFSWTIPSTAAPGNGYYVKVVTYGDPQDPKVYETGRFIVTPAGTAAANAAMVAGIHKPAFFDVEAQMIGADAFDF